MTVNGEDCSSYKVSYSDRVREGLVELVTLAQQRGLKQIVLSALQIADEKLKTDPHFGEPKNNFPELSLVQWIGIVPPLVIHYGINEEKCLVLVAKPIGVLPGNGLDP